MDYNQMSLKMHEENHGKLEVVSKVAINDRDDLSTAYTPGVAEPCRKIHANPADVYKYTCKANTVAVVSDGTAVLGDFFSVNQFCHCYNPPFFSTLYTVPYAVYHASEFINIRCIETK